MGNEPKREMTPEEASLALIKGMHSLMEHAATIAHAKKAFYDAYVSEGFTPEQALELCKNIIQV